MPLSVTPHFARAGRFPAPRRGFALLITITLVAFLVLLLVSLAALTRVETQVASNSQQLAQARNNALLAVNIAIGQLQKYAGPDQRVTATADLAGNNNGQRLGVGTSPSATVGHTKYWDTTGTVNGLTAVQAGTRYWTGVWGNSYPSTPTPGNDNIYEKTPRPVLLNWLVSGNERVSFAVDTSADFGKITAANGTFGSGGTAPAASPATPIGTAITAGMSALTPITYNGVANRAILLVGPGTAGTSKRTLSPAEEAFERYIVAPLVDIQVPANTLPGLGSDSTATTIGRYAYWVGDEGVKARLNLVDPYAANTNPASDPKARFRLMTAPRSGVEVASDFNTNSTIATAYAGWSQSTASNPPLANVLGLPQARLLDSSNIVLDETGSSRVRLDHHVHDFTTASIGVEADSLNGGLRKDLTYYFEQGTLPTWTDVKGAVTGRGYGIIPSSYSPTDAELSISSPSIQDKLLPKWDILGSFYGLPATSSMPLTGSSSDTVNIQPATATQMGITPVIVQMRLMLGIHLEKDSENPANSKLRVLANPLLVLANPYTVDLNFPAGLDFTIKLDSRVTSNELIINPGGYKVFGAGSVFDGTNFNIPAGTRIPAGKARVFSYTGDPVPSTGTIPLSPGFNAARFSNVYREYNWTPPALPANIHFLAREDAGNTSFLVEFSVPGSGQLLQQLNINPNRQPSGYPSVYIDPASTADHPMFVYNFAYNSPASSQAPPNYTGAAAGIANTQLRSFADFNPRAGYFRILKKSYSSAPYTGWYLNSGSPISDGLGYPLPEFLGSPYSLAGSPDSSTADQYWARDWTAPSTGTPVTLGALFDIPRRTKTGSTVTPTDMPLLSLGGLQHANLTAEDLPPAASRATQFGSASVPPPNPGHQPAYAFGNSYASILLPREKALDSSPSQPDVWLMTTALQTTFSPAPRYFDISYLLNASIWDSYFFSSIPQSGGDFSPVNPRLGLRVDVSPSAALVRDGQQAAAHTLIKGAFNINSTSVDAWVAVLAGMRNLPALNNNDTQGPTTMFPRSIRQPAAGETAPVSDGPDSYGGFRRLTDGQIKTLALRIVQQVRMRGPFVSLSHFINRTLVAAGSDSAKGFGQSGPLQAAIDLADLNLPFTASATSDLATIPTVDDGLMVSGDASGRGTNSLFADGTAAGSPNPLRRSTAIPGWLTQADVLQAIGPVISARSDTFIIRAYGEVRNPLDSSTSAAPLARAWCEVTVQRTPDYVDQTDSALTNNRDTNNNALLNACPPSLTNTINQTYGRRFEIVSFRWLGAGDI